MESNRKEIYDLFKIKETSTKKNKSLTVKTILIGRNWVFKKFSILMGSISIALVGFHARVSSLAILLLSYCIPVKIHSLK